MADPIRRLKWIQIQTLVGVCPRCGEDFQPTRETHVYCSKRCRNAVWAQKVRDAEAASRASCGTVHDGSDHRESDS